MNISQRNERSNEGHLVTHQMSLDLPKKEILRLPHVYAILFSQNGKVSFLITAFRSKEVHYNLVLFSHNR